MTHSELRSLPVGTPLILNHNGTRIECVFEGMMGKWAMIRTKKRKQNWLASIIENLEARFKAKKFNIWTEQVDPKRKPDLPLRGDWIANYKLYYGHPLDLQYLDPQYLELPE